MQLLTVDISEEGIANDSGTLLVIAYELLYNCNIYTTIILSFI